MSSPFCYVAVLPFCRYDSGSLPPDFTITGHVPHPSICDVLKQNHTLVLNLVAAKSSNSVCSTMRACRRTERKAFGQSSSKRSSVFTSPQSSS